MFYLPPPIGYSGETRRYDDTQFMVAAEHVAALEMMAAAWDMTMSEALGRAVTWSFKRVDEHALTDARRRLWPVDDA